MAMVKTKGLLEFVNDLMSLSDEEFCEKFGFHGITKQDCPEKRTNLLSRIKLKMITEHASYVQMKNEELFPTIKDKYSLFIERKLEQYYETNQDITGLNKIANKAMLLSSLTPTMVEFIIECIEEK